MKTIEEAAKEYAKKQAILGHTFADEVTKRVAEHACYKTALQMAEFAKRWIPVNEELPETESETDKLSKVVICKSPDLANEFSGYYDKIHNLWRLYPASNSIKVTHWRPIELK